MKRYLAYDAGNTGIQCMPFAAGLIGLTNGTYDDVSLIRCNTDGELTLSWKNGTTDTVSMVAGDYRSIPGMQASITINSGSFDFA